MTTHSDEAKATKTLLTALRVFQAERKRNPAGVGFDDNLFNELLTDNEIDDLCATIGTIGTIATIGAIGAIAIDSKFKHNVNESSNSVSDDSHEKSLIALRVLKSYYINNKTDARLEFEENDGSYTDFIFRFDSDSVPFDEHNTDVYAKITCTIDWLENKLYCTATLDSDEMGDCCSLTVPLSLQHQVNEVCKKLIAEQRRVLSDAGINLSTVNDTPKWNCSFLLEQPKTVNKTIYELLKDYHLSDLTKTASDFRLNSIKRDDKSQSVFVSISQNLINTLQDQNNTEVTADIRYRIGRGGQKSADELAFGCTARLKSKESNVSDDLPIPLSIQKEVRETCAALAVDIKYFLSTNGINLDSVDDKPAWPRPDLLEMPSQKADSGYEEWSKVLEGMAGEVNHERDEDDDHRLSAL